MNKQSMCKRFLSVAAVGAVAVGVLFWAGCSDKKEPVGPPSTYTLTLLSEPTGAGNFTPEERVFEAGSVITVTVSPKSPKYRFIGWDGASTSNDSVVTIAMDGNKTLTAKFETLFELKTIVEPAGAGTVTRKPESVYDTAKTRVTLTANANVNSGYIFDGWVVNDSIIETDVQVRCTVISDTIITAKFHKRYQIFVTITGKGNVEFDPVGPFYDEGQEVKLTATPGENFMSWRNPAGNILGDDPELTITIDKNDVRLTAKFDD